MATPAVELAEWPGPVKGPITSACAAAAPRSRKRRRGVSSLYKGPETRPAQGGGRKEGASLSHPKTGRPGRAAGDPIKPRKLYRLGAIMVVRLRKPTKPQLLWFLWAPAFAGVNRGRDSPPKTALAQSPAPHPPAKEPRGPPPVALNLSPITKPRFSPFKQPLQPFGNRCAAPPRPE